MILKTTVGKETNDVHSCDFCKSSYSEKVLTRTGNIRYSPAHEKMGLEMICNKCRDQLNKIG